MGGVNANSIAFLSLLSFATVLGLLIFAIARRERSGLGQAVGLCIVAVIIALDVYVLKSPN